MKVFINTDELIKDFDLSKFSRNTAKFDSNDLYIMNKKKLDTLDTIIIIIPTIYL